MISLLLLALGPALAGGAGSPWLPDSLGRRWPLPQAESSADSLYWVLFLDKGVLDVAALREECRLLKPQLLRAGRVREPDALDLPVPERYVTQVVATGAGVRHTSRWLNAVSVRASVAQLVRIQELPCVAGYTPVARGRRVPDLKGAREFSTAAASYPEDYGVSLMQLLPLQVPELQALGLSGRGVLVGVFDTGFLLTHQAFAPLTADGRVLARWDFVHGDTSVANDSLDVPGQDGHGSEVLSTMAGYAPGELVGPATGASYLLAKTEDTGSETPVEEDHYVAALEWADSLGARVVSTSLSYDFGYVMDGTQGISTVAANTAASRGMLLVTAMGNSGPGPTSMGAPADAMDVVSVGAVDAQGVVAVFSSRGPTSDGRVKPEVVAQGVSVYAADPSVPDAYTLVSGTSFATPLVSAAAALLIEAHADWSPLMLREALMHAGNQWDTPDNSYGSGQPRLLVALDHQPAGALQIEPRWYDAYDSSAWQLAVSAGWDGDRKPASTLVTYKRSPGGEDSVFMASADDSLWQVTLPFEGEEALWWQVRMTDTLGRVSTFPPGPGRWIEMLRLPDSLSEGFESGGLRWVRGGTHKMWWPSAASAYEGTFCLSDSPGGGYPDACDSWTETRLPLCLQQGPPWTLRFATRYQFADGDSGWVEWKSAGDTLWQTLEALGGSRPDWHLRSFVLAGTAGDSVWLRFRLTSDGAVTGDGWYIDNVYLGASPLDVRESIVALPKSPRLGAPAPNPFNQSTRLGFELDRPTNVRLFVYDVLGRLVRTLCEGHLAAGPQSFEWNGTDEHGKTVASGLYLVRLEVNQQSHTRKLVLLK